MEWYALKKLGDLDFCAPFFHYGYVELANKCTLRCILDILKEQSQNSSL
jgi:hypothetical protein